MAHRLLIIGAGMATAYLLQELGQLVQAGGRGLQITVIGAEPQVCYNRVMLSAVLAGETDASDLPMLADDTLAGAVTFLASTRVDGVDTLARTVLTDKGQRLDYDTLVFATGASVARPKHLARGVAGVEELRTLDDIRRLQDVAMRGGRAVVLGGGLLGLEAAHGLNRSGLMTTVLHRGGHLMNRQLDAPGGQLLQQKIAASGVRFMLGCGVQRLQEKRGRLAGVVLPEGEVLPCELLLVATGITPNAALACASGLAVDRGVLVDSSMRTSKPDIYALGECSQRDQYCFGLVAPIRAQARVLARRLLSMEEQADAFECQDWPTQLKIAGIEIFSAGDPAADGEELVLRDRAAGVYRRLLLRGDHLVSAVLVGDKRGGAWYSELIRQRADVSSFRSTLMFGRQQSHAGQKAARAA